MIQSRITKGRKESEEIKTVSYCVDRNVGVCMYVYVLADVQAGF